MVEHLTGDWKDFTFHMATATDHDRILKHLCEHFLKDEPMYAALGWCDTNAAEQTRSISLGLNHKISYYVTKKKTDEIVAVNLLMDSTKDGFGFTGLPPIESPILAKIAVFMEKLEDTTLHNYHVQMKWERYVEIITTSVAAEYRGKGIGKEMYRRMISFLKAEGYQAVQGGLSSFGTRAIANQLGFTELGRLYLLDHLDENGQKVFPKAKEGEFVAEMVKVL